MRVFKRKKKIEDQFPVLMENMHTGKVVLFTDLTTGTVVVSGGIDPSDYDSVGVHSTTWLRCDDQSVWKKTNEIIELQNT